MERKVRPILMQGPLVIQSLEGKKTNTRRILKPQPFRDGDDGTLVWKEGRVLTPDRVAQNCPYGKPGDLLWVRENWKPDTDGDVSCISYEADKSSIHIENTQEAANRWLEARRTEEQYPYLRPTRWRPSIHMPRWASRLTLEIENVSIEQLQEITNSDALREGVEFRDGCYGVWRPNGTMVCGGGDDAIDAFRCLWININGTGSWDKNPWVWVVRYKAHKKNVDKLLSELSHEK